MCRACLHADPEERMNRHGWVGLARTVWPRPKRSTPVSWRLRGGWPSEAVADAMTQTADARSRTRARAFERSAEIDDLRAELERTEALLSARIVEAETRR